MGRDRGRRRQRHFLVRARETTSAIRGSGVTKVKGVKTPSGMTDRWARMLVELRDLVYQRVAERRQRETSSLDRAREALSGR